MKYDMDSEETKAVYDKWVEKQRGANEELKEVLEKWKNTTRQKIVGYDKWIFEETYNSKGKIVLAQYYLMRGSAQVYKTAASLGVTEFSMQLVPQDWRIEDADHKLKKRLLKSINGNFKTYIKELERELDPNSKLA